MPDWQEVILLSTTMFLICMLCHGEIVRSRPHAVHLTLFSMLVSLGGVFVSLVAPPPCPRGIPGSIIGRPCSNGTVAQRSEQGT